MGKIQNKAGVKTKLFKVKPKGATFKLKPKCIKNFEKSKSFKTSKNLKTPKNLIKIPSEENEDVLENSDEEDLNESLNNEEIKENNIDEDSNSDDEDVNIQENKFKESLAKLQETDAEFYNFLKENDKKLLSLNFSDDEDEVDSEEEIDELHKPEGKLEVASDESDFEDESVKRDGRVVTLKLLKTWRKDIETDASNKTLTTLIKAFHAAVLSVSADNSQDISEFKVEGSAVFNGIIQVCVLELGPAIRRYLKISPGSKQPPHKCKRFIKIKAVLRGYFTDLLKILKGVTSPNILTVLLKHLHYMAPMLVSYGNVTKSVLKKLTDLWSTSEENVRVVAFLCILRMVTNQQQSLLDLVLKMMHLAYVRNSKFVSTSTLPGINFMRRSLVEMYALDVNVAYQHVFLNIRQLAIHLRNAITVKKKENIQTVYNWQFINSLRLWGSLLSMIYEKPQMKPLIYPFVQVCLGTLKLVPTTQYYPLRFHVTQVLIDLSSKTRVFIPILPFIIEILSLYDFNKKHQKVSMKPLHFTCILRLSKSQLLENGFKDALIDAIYSQLLEYLANNSSSLAYPDLTLFVVVQLKQFLKTCNIASYCRKIKQILEKIEQNSKFIEKERKSIQFNLKDSKGIDAWESLVINKGTPLKEYYENWNKLRTIKRNKEATGNDKLGEYNLPILKKGVINKKVSDEKVELFPSDSESEEETQLKKKRGKRGGKNVNKKKKVIDVSDDFGDYGDQDDIVEDIKLDDW
ncbi:nucleolar complex protein 2 [Onthophagus taurus]|uniref:nucleolar complex protein 2 n=1 Tax=Onthophagus taurus TaxID=166361 RepID=UPI000C206FDD|nr:nucleolar complex protein 2 homolog [Onthophagus taurus]